MNSCGFYCSGEKIYFMWIWCSFFFSLSLETILHININVIRFKTAVMFRLVLIDRMEMNEQQTKTHRKKTMIQINYSSNDKVRIYRVWHFCLSCCFFHSPLILCQAHHGSPYNSQNHKLECIVPFVCRWISWFSGCVLGIYWTNSVESSKAVN